MDHRAKKIQSTEAVFAKIEFIFMVICGVGIVGLTFLVVLDVTVRYFFSSPIPGGVEATELILPYIVFIGMSYTLPADGHVRVNILLNKFPKFLRNSADSVDCIIGIAFFGLLTYFGTLHFWESFRILEFMMAPFKLPWWVGKFSMPLGTLAITLRFIFRLIDIIAGSQQEQKTV